MTRRTLRTNYVLSIAVLAVAWAGAATGARSPQPGIDPGKEPLVASFACYSSGAGDAYAAPGFILEIRPGRRYRVPMGEGTFAIDPTETVQTVRFTTGPLVAAIPTTAVFDDQGQRLTRITPNGGAPAECYQQGPRDQAIQREFHAKDPQPGTYPCVNRQTGVTAGAVEILPGRRYFVDGQQGTYTVDVLGDQREDWSDVEFTSGPLTGAYSTFTGDVDSGMRNLRLGTDPSFSCVVVVAPTPHPRFGAVKAPKRPRASNAISGLYAAYTVDITGVCGGLCWSFRTFTPNGWVYTREPQTGRGDAACARTRPNGLTVCERYVVRGNTIRIGDDPRVRFARGKDLLKVGGTTYRLVSPFRPKRRLSGAYRSQYIIETIPGVSAAASYTTFTFTTAGRFTREGSVGAFFSPPAGQAGVPVAVASQNGSAGTYRVLPGTNTIELRYDNGVVRRLFAFIPVNSGRFPRPKLLLMGGSSYLPT